MSGWNDFEETCDFSDSLPHSRVVHPAGRHDGVIAVCRTVARGEQTSRRYQSTRSAKSQMKVEQLPQRGLTA